MLAFNKGWYLVHGSRSEQRVGSNKVLKYIGFELLQEGPHSRTFKLEDPQGFSLGKKVENLGIVKGDCAKINIPAVVFLYKVHSIPNDSQGSKSKKVHL